MGKIIRIDIDDYNENVNKDLQIFIDTYLLNILGENYRNILRGLYDCDFTIILCEQHNRIERLLKFTEGEQYSIITI
jgi:hypothetical protein